MPRCKLWLLRPKPEDKLWEPWWDKTFGFVVRAKTEEEARALAQAEGGNEVGFSWRDETYPAWADPAHSTCEVLTGNGKPGVIIEDHANG